MQLHSAHIGMITILQRVLILMMLLLLLCPVSSLAEEEPEEEEGMGEKEWPPEIQAMPHYPDDGSIQIIDDAVVVNF